MLTDYGDNRDEHNRRIIESSHAWEIEGPYTNGVVAECATLREAEMEASEHRCNHLAQGFNLSSTIVIYGVDISGVRVGALR